MGQRHDINTAEFQDKKNKKVTFVIGEGFVGRMLKSIC